MNTFNKKEITSINTLNWRYQDSKANNTKRYQNSSYLTAKSHTMKQGWKSSSCNKKFKFKSMRKFIQINCYVFKLRQYQTSLLAYDGTLHGVRFGWLCTSSPPRWWRSARRAPPTPRRRWPPRWSWQSWDKVTSVSWPTWPLAAQRRRGSLCQGSAPNRLLGGLRDLIPSDCRHPRSHNQSLAGIQALHSRPALLPGWR